MTKLGIVVGEENWTFLREIADDLANHFQIRIYKRKTYNTPLLNGKVNRWALQQGISSMMRSNDICFFEWASELLMIASNLPKRSSIVTRLHSFELYDWAPRINWDSVDLVIFVSQAIRQKFSELYPEHHHKTMVVYNGVSLDKFKPSGQKNFNFNLGMLCNFAPIKRIYDVILTVYELTQLGYNAHLHIAGKPDVNDLRYASAIYRLVDKLDLKNRVTFYGYVSDTPAWLNEIDIFISNSYWEGQQVALLEAMAAGCYCLSHIWDGAEEILPPENLYIVDSELQKKVIEYSEMSEGEKLESQSKLRSIVCEKFDINQTKAQIQQVIEKLTENRVTKK